MAFVMEVLNSGVYEGQVRHRRSHPKPHSFTYNVFMMYLDLDEIDEVLNSSYLWSKKSWHLAQYRRSDFYGCKNKPLKESIIKKVSDELGFSPNGSICMLTNLRYYGYTINPLTVYYCFNSNHKLQALVLEVTNTPWGEKQQYVIACDTESSLCKSEFNKSMHVSPFHPMNMTYDWQSNTPNQFIHIYMKNKIDGLCVFDAELSLKRQEITQGFLSKIILKYPFMTAKVCFSIYWQALRLWLKKNPIYKNPNNRRSRQKN
jgi:DUF1365 family protein